MSLGFGPISDGPISDVGGAASSAAGTSDRIQETAFGPPMQGSPWASYILYVEPLHHMDQPAAPSAATPSGPQAETTFGPPILGAPWSGRLYVEPTRTQTSPFTPAGFPPGTASLPVRSLPFLERVPTIEGPVAQDRMRRAMEKLSSIVNSLISQGQLTLSGFDSNSLDWTIGVAGGSPMGTVTSVDVVVPSEFTVSGSPITTSGTITITKVAETANTVWVGPASGAAAQPTFRLLVDDDVQISGLFFADNGPPSPSFKYTGDYYLDLTTGVLYKNV